VFLGAEWGTEPIETQFPGAILRADYGNEPVLPHGLKMPSL